MDWNGKLALIEAAKISNVKRFIFFSAQNVEQFENIPVMKLKYEIEKKLQESGLNYTIFRLSAFYQGLIEQYAIPVLENIPIWVTNENSQISYMNTQDIAKFCIRAFQIPQTSNQTFILSGVKGWISSEIISLCEQLANQKATIRYIPVFTLKFASFVFGK